MTLKTLIESQATTVFLNTNEFANSVIQRPKGVAADATTVTAVVEHLPTENVTERGHGFSRRAILHLAESVAVDDRDRWSINNQWWETERVDEPEGGLRRVHVTRTDKHAATSGDRTSRGN